MPTGDPGHITALIEQVKAAAASPQNQERLARHPRAVFGMEEPIASARLWGYDVNHYFGDPLFYCEQTLRQKLWRWEQFPDDDAPITANLSAWLGYYPDYTYAGMAVAFDQLGVPQLQTDHPLARDPDLRLLKPVDFHTSGWMPRVLRWHDELERISAGRLQVDFAMTWWRGCLDMAIQLRGYENLMTDAVKRPAFVHGLLEFLVEQRCRWWEAYRRHFGLRPGPAGVADDWVNVPFISPQFFADFVLPRYLELERFHNGLAGFHSCGNQAPVQTHLLELGSLANLEVSPWTSLEQSLAALPSDKTLIISLHPNEVLAATPEQMEARLQTIVTACQGRAYHLGTSGLTPIWDSPLEFVERIRTWTGAVQRVLTPYRRTAAAPAVPLVSAKGPHDGNT